MNKADNNKIILGIALVGAVALTGLQTAAAGPGGGPGGLNVPPCGDCAGYGYGRQQLSDDTQKARDKFLDETTQIRKELTVKRAEKRALMNSENPDAKRVAQLTSELFDLREQMRSKAQELGLNDEEFMGREYGRGYGRRCNGPGPGAYFQKPL
ncbi:MAG: periplasmic heavy metal sensor [Desulfobulbaceae bacterium]|nr:periplasmic heavy metal sensor [Desulfobulbaceae bacterium]